MDVAKKYGYIATGIGIGAVFMLFLVQFTDKKTNDSFRNVELNGKVVQKNKDEKKFEKTNTIVLTNNVRYTIPHLDLDSDIDIGDSIVKIKTSYEITIYKQGNLYDKIIYALPYTE